MIKGSLGGGATPDKDMPKFIKLDMKKKLI